ncbi:putative adenosine monophosphate-protein transferase Fic [Xenorhabdus bovienii]|uniref:putative adenosine monophosphate-protein transferase Fic n=2 Tax=Xenorhabdus bovienii TaxID=40576 RepID=UPI00237D1D85|nr:putative adenosine monophosphate-protein transferase Fic [Xenorhabdus bovienii]MDE1473955.1 putative adenosine monophosphate-protein transferase Fic [Xenorhabdus bovienii]MDE1482902.1 putative adenosine monophosphate-protein transferase Fic [Xenorhabdus bovienii]MDE9426924.1 putative adenosine monophosphate-protein transferase Fic [Xenorhabdus bovienii]MDE9431684.1 putative adenosine monophosphate-protein transferase Fic [Xenorhabdus bovienii]MDE9441855.1 putative adenosine monophosphate-pr
MDKYDVSYDQYCYDNSSVLKNKLNINDIYGFEKAERDITSITILRVSYSPPPYNIYYFKLLHKAIFSEIFDWAGEIRTVDISKNNTRFCNVNRIEPEAEKLFSQLENEQWLIGLEKEEFCKKLAEYYCEFNIIHPFREGNGRVQRLFFEHLALSAGYELDWQDIEVTEWINANIDGVFVNYEPMKIIFKRIIKVAVNYF